MDDRRVKERRVGGKVMPFLERRKCIYTDGRRIKQRRSGRDRREP